MTLEPTRVADKVYRMIEGNADAIKAIDEVIAKASASLRIFDHSLEHRGFNTPERFEALRQFMLHSRANQIQIVLHDTDTLERDCPRLLMLLRQFPTGVHIHRSTGVAQQAHDPFIIADQMHFWHKLHYQHPRSVLTLNSHFDAKPLLDRFDEIWESSEFAVSASAIGL